MKNSVAQLLHDKTILITGGTGSFGTTVASHLLDLSPKRIVIFSRDEKKQFDMRHSFSDKRLKFVIGDVRDRESVVAAMEGVDYVFHAAALKQVPSCEFFPLEAVKTNIIGAENVLRLAIAAGVARVVILSTDKAAYPINAMGMTKALMEKTMVALAREAEEKGNHTTVICGVRYGNVLYSRGSVVPYFVELIKQGKTLTVTDPRMTRFLLPLANAVDLVFHALADGQNGHIYVRKAPACTIQTLAKAVIKIFRYRKGFVEVGVRAGEKLHETLVTAEELFRVVDQGDYFDIPPESQGLDYNQYFFRGKHIDPLTIEPYTSGNTKRLNVAETEKLLLTLPEIKKELALFKKR